MTSLQGRDEVETYRATLLIRNSAPLGPYSRTMPRILWKPQGGMVVSYARGTPVIEFAPMDEGREENRKRERVEERNRVRGKMECGGGGGRVMNHSTTTRHFISGNRNVTCYSLSGEEPIQALQGYLTNKKTHPPRTLP